MSLRVTPGITCKRSPVMQAGLGSPGLGPVSLPPSNMGPAPSFAPAVVRPSSERDGASGDISPGLVPSVPSQPSVAFLDGKAAAAPTTLIPQPLPTSALLHVLTTSEGRDKMFKVLQYVLKLSITVLNVEGLLPPEMSGAAGYWSARLAVNTKTVRNGRSMFKLGRWVITLLHLQAVLSRLAGRREEPRRDHAAAAEGSTRIRERSVRFSTSYQEAVFRPAAAAAAKECRRPTHVFPALGMSLLALRCALSVVRNVTRDGLYMGDKELFGFSLTGGVASSWLPSRGLMQRLANRLWLCVALIDLVLNSWRLFKRGWVWGALEQDTRRYCECNLLTLRDDGEILWVAPDPTYVRRPEDLVYPPLDLDFGSVQPTSPKFFEAAPPRDLRPSCRACGWTLQSVPSMDRLPEHRTTEDIAVRLVQWAAGIGRVGVRSGRQVMLLPHFFRRLRGLSQCMQAHHNFRETVLLECRYVADVVLASGYVFGDYEPAEGAGGMVAQHVHVVGTCAGLISGCIALRRVVLSAQ